MASSTSHHASRASAFRTTTESPRPYACPHPGCGRRFKRKYTLKEHSKTHTGEKPFVCPVRACRKSFATSGNLTRHKRLHPWLDAPLLCLADGCECSFANEAKLEHHMVMVHFGLSDHHCPVAQCGKAFSTGGNLRRHMKQQHSADRLDRLSVSSNSTTEADGMEADVGSPVAVDRYQPLPLHHLGWTSSAAYECEDEDVCELELLGALSCLFDDGEITIAL